MDNYQKKISHFLLRLKDKEVHLKCDDYDQKNKWVGAIRYFRARHQSTICFNERYYKETLDDETKIQIYAENEQRHWDQVKVLFACE